MTCDIIIITWYYTAS